MKGTWGNIRFNIVGANVIMGWQLYITPMYINSTASGAHRRKKDLIDNISDQDHFFIMGCT
jgi:hypothetical protein